MQEVQISTTNGTLSGNFFPAPAATENQHAAALLIHGWKSGQDRMFDTAEMLSKKSGIQCLTFDLRGHGESPGVIDQLSRKNFLDDVLAAYDFLIKQPNVNPNKIGVLGSSFGAYLASLLSARRKIAWMVLRAPADYSDGDLAQPKMLGGDETTVNEWRMQPKNWNATEALRAVHSFKGKILIVESENDDLVPHQTVQNYVDAVSEKRDMQYALMEGAPHSLSKFPDLKKQFNEIVFEWGKQKSGGAYTEIWLCL
ncbi:alpha/beta fold hydrolase [Candidatus Parcubacteria bacterium]|nr:alpha/beta fold hydrolase [Candidatus Parcubacteria bacterium]